MANYRTEWQAISERIAGLLEATEVTQRLCQNPTSDEGAYPQVLAPHTRQLFALICDYHRRHEHMAPAALSGAIGRFVNDHRGRFEAQVSGPDHLPFLKRTIPALASIRAEVDYLLRDTHAVMMRMTERAFTHLQRSIIADCDIKRKWHQVFTKGKEPDLERLGAVHLLSHGIWAFKAYAEGERTDLVLGEPLTDLDQVAATAEGLVLTEWKKVADPRNLREYASLALEGAARYARSALADIELAQYRYLVLVSEKDLTGRLPPNEEKEGVTYRHINIAVDPEDPCRLSAPS